MVRQIFHSSLKTLLIAAAFFGAAVLFASRFANHGAQADETKPAVPADAQKSEQKTSSPSGESAKTSSQAELEKKFQETLSGATFQGHFTNNRDEKGSSPKEDKYTIQSATKMQGDIWLFTSRIQYGTHDITLPLPLRVVWAGDTPVITLDKVPVPGMGSFTARVMIFDNQYAGMWDGGDHGGLLYGKIVKAAAKDQ
jgi:hypothetical protein